MIKYTVRTVAGYFKLECDLRDFEEALRIVRKRSEQVEVERKTNHSVKELHDAIIKQSGENTDKTIKSTWGRK